MCLCIWRAACKLSPARCCPAPNVCEQRFGKHLVMLLRPWSQPPAAEQGPAWLSWHCRALSKTKPSSQHLDLAHSSPVMQDREANGWPRGAKYTGTGITLVLGCSVLLGEDAKLLCCPFPATSWISMSREGLLKGTGNILTFHLHEVELVDGL